MANVGVTFDFAAESAKLRSEIDKVRKEVGSLNKTADGISSSFKTMGTALAAAVSVTAVTSFVARIADAADKLNDLGGRLNANVGNLQVLQIAAEQAGGSADAMNTALAKMTDTLGSAVNGNQAAASAFDRLGLSARQLVGLKTDEAMQRISAALSAVPNDYQRAALAQDIFGKGAKDLAGFFADAPGAVADVSDELDKYGARLKEIDVSKIGVANDLLAMQKTIAQNVAIGFVADLSPAALVASDSIATIGESLAGAGNTGEMFGTILVGAIKAIEAAVQGLISWFHLFRGIGAKAFEAITSGAASVLSTLGSAADALGLDWGLSLQRAAEVARGWSDAYRTGAEAAFASAQAAKEAAFQAGSEVLRMDEVFQQTATNLQQRAEAALARQRQGQGNSDPAAARRQAGTNVAGDRARGDPSLAGYDYAPTLDPLSDPAVLAEMAKNQVLQDLQDQHAQTMLGKIEAFNQTALGSFLGYNSLVEQSEQSKNQALGQGMNQLVQMAINQGGRLGKIGKAIAIAQTIWSTAQAIMKAMAEVPYPYNIAAAAGAAAMGVAQLANIKKTNIGSGGSIIGAKGGGIQATSPALAAPASLSDNVPGTQKADQQTVAQVVINGNIFSSQETPDWIVEQLREAISRDVVFINGSSRQAMELAGAT